MSTATRCSTASAKIEQLSARQMREPAPAIAMYLAALADVLDSPPGKIRTTS